MTTSALIMLILSLRWLLVRSLQDSRGTLVYDFQVRESGRMLSKYSADLCGNKCFVRSSHISSATRFVYISPR